MSGKRECFWTKIKAFSVSFVSGLMMMPATVLAYFQLGQFLMLVMVFSWFYSTFIFLSICAVIGPKDNFGQLSISNLFRQCYRSKAGKETTDKTELVILKNQGAVSDRPSEQANNVATLNPNAVSDVSPEKADNSIL